MVTGCHFWLVAMLLEGGSYMIFLKVIAQKRTNHMAERDKLNDWRKSVKLSWIQIRPASLPAALLSRHSVHVEVLLQHALNAYTRLCGNKIFLTKQQIILAVLPVLWQNKCNENIGYTG